MIRAFVDESESNHQLDPGAYLLGGAVVFEDDVARVDRTMQGLRLNRNDPKLHWRNESDKQQLRIAEAVEQLPVQALIVAHVDVDARPASRRNRAMKRLLPELVQHGVALAQFESRGPKDDARDRKVLDGLRQSRRLQETPGERLRMEHPRGPEEPGLWLADVICGAVVAARSGDRRFVEILGPRLRVLTTV